MKTNKSRFIERLIEILQSENKERSEWGDSTLDINFMIAPIDQQLNTCEEFLKDISNYEYTIDNYQYFTEATIRTYYMDDIYIDGTIDIRLLKNNESEEAEPLPYFYKLLFKPLFFLSLTSLLLLSRYVFKF